MTKCVFCSLRQFWTVCVDLKVKAPTSEHHDPNVDPKYASGWQLKRSHRNHGDMYNIYIYDIYTNIMHDTFLFFVFCFFVLLFVCGCTL